MFEKFDKDGNGVLDFEEFQELTRYMGLSLSTFRCKKLFSEADKDGSHILDSKEFEVALKALRNEASSGYVHCSCGDLCLCL